MLHNKIALITGASKGIGKGIAISLAKEGATVIVNYNKDETSALKVVEDIKKIGSYAIAIQGDISDYKTAKKLVNNVIEKFSKIDILVNNAGICNLGLFIDLDLEKINKIINTNLMGSMYMCHSVLPYMINKKSGRIINISSVWGNVGASCEAVYSATKGGINSFTKALAKEMAMCNITVNAVAPGVIDTDMNKWLSFEEKQSLEEEIPLGRFGKVEEVASMVTHLCKDEASYITGQVITVDGGYI